MGKHIGIFKRNYQSQRCLFGLLPATPQHNPGYTVTISLSLVLSTWGSFFLKWRWSPTHKQNYGIAFAPQGLVFVVVTVVVVILLGVVVYVLWRCVVLFTLQGRLYSPWPGAKLLVS
ncbi:hypothetical protein Tco_1456013 [Tanacetum coccineum]